MSNPALQEPGTLFFVKRSIAIGEECSEGPWIVLEQTATFFPAPEWICCCLESEYNPKALPLNNRSAIFSVNDVDYVIPKGAQSFDPDKAEARSVLADIAVKLDGEGFTTSAQWLRSYVENLK